MNGNDSDKKPKISPVLAPEQLELYREALLWLFRWTLGVIGIITVLLVIMDSFNVKILTILVLVVLAGALGALFSALTRLYSLRQLPAAIVWGSLNRPKGEYLLVFCLVPPIVGMIGATFFYVFMQSGIIAGNVFVNFTCERLIECEGLGCLLSYSPCLPADYAKAVVWGFVAGFSERMIPNILARLENAGYEK